MSSGDGIVFLGANQGGRSSASTPVGAGTAQDARASPRKAVAGRLKLTTDTGAKHAGRMVDMSAHGFCALLDDPVKLGILCLVDCEVNLRGSARMISAIARSIHSVLVSGKGYRVGFQFTQISDGSAEVVRALLAH